MIPTPDQAVTMDSRSIVTRQEFDASNQVQVAAVIDNATLKYVDLKAFMREIVINTIHPINSVISTLNPANPSTYYPGTTWAAYAQGRCLVGVAPSGTFAAPANRVGGAETVALNIAQLPVHTHMVMGHSHTVPSHTHTINHGHVSPLTYNLSDAGNADQPPTSEIDARTMMGPFGEEIVSGSGRSLTVRRIISQNSASRRRGLIGQPNNTVNLPSGGSGVLATSTIPTDNTAGIGSNQAHTNLQPWTNVFFWLRTA